MLFRLAGVISWALGLAGVAAVAAGQCGTQLITQFAQPVEKIATIDASRVIVARGDRLEIFSVSTPSTPTFLGGVTLPNRIRKLECNSTRAWVVTEDDDGNATLRVFSVVTSTPVQTSANAVGSDVDPVGDVAYSVNLAAGIMQIVDYSFGEFPLLLGQWTTSWAGYDRVRVTVIGSRAFIALRDDDEQRSTLQVVSIADPEFPVLVGQFSDIGLPDFGALAATGNIVYACRDEQLDVLNLNSLPNIQRSSTIADEAQWVAISGTTLYVGALYSGVKTYNIATNVISPPLLGTFVLEGRCVWGSFGTSRLYAAADGGGFEILNTTNPGAMTRLGWMDKAIGEVRDIQTVDAGFTYVLDTVGLRVVNTTNPAAPTILRSIPFIGTSPDWNCAARVLRVGIGNLYITGCGGSLWVYSLANANNPALVSLTHGLGSDYDLKQVGSFLYGGGQGGMRIINVTNPASPALAGTYTAGGVITQVEAANGLLYVGTRDNGLWIMDDVNPTVPQLIGFLGNSPGVFEGLRVDAATAYTLDSNPGVLTAIDITNPSAPGVIVERPFDGTSGDSVDRRGNTLLYVGSREVRFADVSARNEIVRTGAFPGGNLSWLTQAADLNASCAVVAGTVSVSRFSNATPGQFDGGLYLLSVPTQWSADWVQYPGDTTTCRAGFVEFETDWRASPGVTSYRWWKDFAPLADSDHILGAASPRLVIPQARQSDAGQYYCVARNACGSTLGPRFRLTVCSGDFDCSGGIDGDDVIAFFGAWDAGVIEADANEDGSVDGDDVIVFFAGWDAGC
ncbi:MAG: hypothetical protein ACOYN0_02640 [Phycisphaerales bacterium]